MTSADQCADRRVLVQEIEEACGNLLGLTNGMKEAADEVWSARPALQAARCSCRLAGERRVAADDGIDRQHEIQD